MPCNNAEAQFPTPAIAKRISGTIHFPVDVLKAKRVIGASRSKLQDG
jgi:hypothetical protein